MRDDTRRAIVAEARTWLNTPYRHQGRRKGHGVDCLGLISGVARSLGLVAYDRADYAPQPDGALLKRECDRLLVQQNAADLNAYSDQALGSVLLLWIAARNLPQHMAIVTDLPGRLGIIHAHQMLGSVREHGLDSFWLKRIIAVYDFPGVA